jgi:cell division protease FtsH
MPKIREIIRNEYDRSLKIIRKHKQVIEKGATLLLEKEKIEGAELKALMEETAKSGGK